MILNFPIDLPMEPVDNMPWGEINKTVYFAPDAQECVDGVHPKISPTISLSGMENHLFIVEIGLIINKWLEIIY